MTANAERIQDMRYLQSRITKAATSGKRDFNEGRKPRLYDDARIQASYDNAYESAYLQSKGLTDDYFRGLKF